MTTNTLVDFSSQVEAFSRSREEPGWLRDRRLVAASAATSAPLPDRVQHLWRYTDPKLFAPSEEGLTQALRPTQGHPETGRSLSWGSLEVRLPVGSEAPGLLVSDLGKAAAEHPELVERALGSVIGSDCEPDGRGKFEALNLAAWSSGSFVYVPRGLRVESPLHVLRSLVGNSAGAPSFLASRLLVILGEDAELTLVDECEGGADGLSYHSVVECIAEASSRLRYVSIQRLSKGVIHHASERARVGRDSNVRVVMASLGGSQVKSDVGSFLDGPGANVELVGFLFGEGRQHFDHHTVHHHRADHTWSDIDFKVVLKDKARSTYTGLIRIEPSAPESEAYQENRNLLLNDGARAESIPELEILTDEVKCTHGATVGTLDPQHIFYLESRGLPKPEAIRLIVGGFVEPTLERIPEEWKDRLRAHVEERLREL